MDKKSEPEVRTHLHSRAIAILVLIALFAPTLRAQWQAVAPALLGAQRLENGAITFQSGIAWAGSMQSVFMSSDSGRTWSNRSPTSLGTDRVIDIVFFDRNTGVVCTFFGGVFRTDDQGLSWREVHRASGKPTTAYTCAFLGSPNNFLVSGGGGGETIDVTRDGGTTWTTTWQVAGGTAPQIRGLLGGSALALVGSKGASLHIIKTTDYGSTWTPKNGTIDFDSYSFGVNICDPDYLYAINEEGTTPINDRSEIFVSSDQGNSWRVGESMAINRKTGQTFFCGSVALTSRAVFAQTSTDGIHRSTDKGVTWKSIGGPGAIFDTRLVCAINSNIILAADNAGTIYRTINSGGDSLPGVSIAEGLAINPNKLFASDSLRSCDAPVIAQIRIQGSLCQPLKVAHEFISGINAIDYGISQSIGDSLRGSDSVLLSFRPLSSGAQRGDYVITLDDSTQIVVPLEGFGKDLVGVGVLSANMNLDTIGGFAQVPIRFKGFTQPEEIQLTLNFDKRLIYNSVHSLAGVLLDTVINSGQTSANVTIPKNEMRLDTNSAIATFIVFPEGDDCYDVSIDSMRVINPNAICTYAIGPSARSTICPPRGCGIMTITKFLLYDSLPQLFLQPNPTSGDVYLTSSVNAIGSTVEMYDAVGREVGRTVIDLKKNMAEKILLGGLRTGSYFLRVTVAGSVRRIRIALMQ